MTDATPANLAATSDALSPAEVLPADLLAVLVCPLTRSPLTQEGDWLVASQPEGAGLRYPIRDGIPILLVDDATLPAEVATLDAFKAQHADVIPG